MKKIFRYLFLVTFASAMVSCNKKGKSINPPYERGNTGNTGTGDTGTGNTGTGAIQARADIGTGNTGTGAIQARGDIGTGTGNTGSTGTGNTGKTGTGNTVNTVNTGNTDNTGANQNDPPAPFGYEKSMSFEEMMQKKKDDLAKQILQKINERPDLQGLDPKIKELLIESANWEQFLKCPKLRMLRLDQITVIKEGFGEPFLTYLLSYPELEKLTPEQIKALRFISAFVLGSEFETILGAPNLKDLDPKKIEALHCTSSKFSSLRGNIKPISREVLYKLMSHPKLEQIHDVGQVQSLSQGSEKQMDLLVRYEGLPSLTERNIDYLLTFSDDNLEKLLRFNMSADILRALSILRDALQENFDLLMGYGDFSELDYNRLRYLVEAPKERLEMLLKYNCLLKIHKGFLSKLIEVSEEYFEILMGYNKLHELEKNQIKKIFALFERPVNELKQYIDNL